MTLIHQIPQSKASREEREKPTYDEDGPEYRLCETASSIALEPKTLIPFCRPENTKEVTRGAGLTWNGTKEAIINILEVFGEVCSFAHISQQQSRVHDACESNLHHCTVSQRSKKHPISHLHS